MFDFLRWLSRKKGPEPKFSEEELVLYCEAKKAALERVLGPMADVVLHTVPQFDMGGLVDMYLFPNGVPGTGFATMELIRCDGSGPKPNRIGTYELVAFTKHPVPEQGGDIMDEGHPIGKMASRWISILTGVGRYSREAVFNPGDACHVPSGKDEPHRCLVFDNYDPDGVGFTIAGKKHCLLLCLEVLASEMAYANENGAASLLARLKEAGSYPFSDLDREPVA
jgi:hypothetical protein